MLRVSVIAVAAAVALAACGSDESPPEPVAQAEGGLTAETEVIETETLETEALLAETEALLAETEALLAETAIEAETEALEAELVAIEAELDALEAELDVLAELEAMMEGDLAILGEPSELLAYDTDCAAGMVLAAGEGCVVDGLGHFYVDDGGELGHFNTEAFAGADGMSSLSISTGTIDDYGFAAANNDDGTWTITAVP